jgi:hypothetical protein
MKKYHFSAATAARKKVPGVLSAPSVKKALILTGITAAGSMLIVSWQHHCSRKTMLLAHKLIMDEIRYKETVHNKE